MSLTFCSPASHLVSIQAVHSSIMKTKNINNFRRTHQLLPIKRPKPSFSHPNHFTCNLTTSSSVPTTFSIETSTTLINEHSAVDNQSKDIHAESLSLLEWPELSQRIIRFSTTELGRIALTQGHPSLVHIPQTQAESEQLLAQTRESYNLEYNLNKPLQLTGASNVAEIAQLATKGKILSGKDLLAISSTLLCALSVRKHLDSLPNPDTFPALISLMKDMRTSPEAAKFIRKYLDDFGDVEDNADPELRSIRSGIRTLVSDIRAMLNDVMSRNSDSIQERVITTRYDRFVIPVKMTRKSDFRRAIIHDASASGSTAYLEPASIRPLNDRLKTLTVKERARVNAILKMLSEKYVAPNKDTIVHVTHVLSKLDAAVARARCSHSLQGVDVVFENDKPLRLHGARHPLLVWKVIEEESMSRFGEITIQSGKHENTDVSESEGVKRFELPPEPLWKQKVIPSSYELNENVRCVCVTGPNTGGKTLSLKTLGICVLMAKAGLFVPATTSQTILKEKFETKESMDSVENPNEHHLYKARIPFFDYVLADIGDDQSLVQSLSTFSGHVQRIKRILAASTSQSLVLLDEIGSGTDPAEGAALGMAILRHLAIEEHAALTFATTHHGELKTLKYGKDETAQYFENASVEFDDIRMAPTYKLIWGIPGRSNALAIASRLGMDKTVVEDAKVLLDGSNSLENGGSQRVDFEKMISSLERDKNAAETAREEAERSLLQIDGMREEMEERLERLRQSEELLRKEQKAAMNAEVKEAKRQIGLVIKEMQKNGVSSQAAGRATQRLEKLVLPGGNRGKKIPNRKIDSDDINVGDKVFVPRLGQSEVEVVQKKSDKEVVVAIGGMRATIKIREVADIVNRSSSDEYEEYKSSREISDNHLQDSKKLHVRTAANTVDIRGQRVEGAQATVDKALDKALAMGAIWIIHGHGTGRLRTGIREYLNQHELVQKIEDAEQEDGGKGVTIAYLA